MRKEPEMEKGKAAEWLFVVALFVPMMILGKLRMHQQDLARFLILGLLAVAVIWSAYALCCIAWRRKQDRAEAPGEDPA